MQDLNKLFYWHGIAENYFNYKGDLVTVPLENRIHLLKSMGVNVESPPAVIKAAFEVDVAPWLNWLQPLETINEGEEAAFDINLTPDELDKEFLWELSSEEAKLTEGKFVSGSLKETGDYQFQNTRYTRREVKLGIQGLQAGYYKLTVQSGKRRAQSTLAVIPRESWQGDLQETTEALWGVIIQLYTLRTQNDWGIGDFGVLRNLIECASASGMDVIGLNPLHTLLPDLEENCSPYSPSDRRFLNPLYIDLATVDEFVAADLTQNYLALPAVERRLSTLRDEKWVDYAGVVELKYPCFQRMYTHFCEHAPIARREAFEAFVAKGGRALQSLGLYEAMNRRWDGCDYTATEATSIWASRKKWEGCLTKHKKAIDFHLYLQWLASEQLESCQNLAQTLGMKLGLVRDLAVGANGSGCEVKSNASLFCESASIGAPPDPFSDLGQNWGIPPMDPAELRQSGFQHYIDLLRANMTSCGALRIDHAMSLLRLWWCPPEETADHGAYVYYPFDTLLGLLKLESVLNRCVIIGEDLGVVPPEFREKMAEARVFANKVFYFEKEHYHLFKAPQKYEKHALAMVNNHDVPTLKSWWDGSDLKLRDRLQLFEEGVDYAQMCQQREEEKKQACNLLKEQGLFPSTWESRSLDDAADFDIIYALLVLNSRTASQIFVIQIEDLLLIDEPTNVPGTFKEYPNWRRKICTEVPKIFADTHVKAVLKSIDRERKND